MSTKISCTMSKKKLELCGKCPPYSIASYILENATPLAYERARIWYEKERVLELRELRRLAGKFKTGKKM